jgi:DNA-binding NarL/FixJ family response regulator
MFREHLGHLIEKTGDMIVSGEADNIRDGLALIDEKRPSIAIVDIMLKGSSGLELVKNMRAAGIEVLRGNIYLNPGFMSQLASRMMTGSDKPAAEPVNRLADRELEVFELIGNGFSSREIGEKLGLGITTVDTYKTRIKDKLNLENMSRLRSEATRWVHERE